MLRNCGLDNEMSWIFSNAVWSFTSSLTSSGRSALKSRLATKEGPAEGWLEELQAEACVDEFDVGRPLVREGASASQGH